MALGIELSRLDLDPQSGLSRLPPRRERSRAPTYEAAFDFHTLLYDLFWSADGRAIVGIGPPLANLERKVLAALRQAYCHSWWSRIAHRKLDRCSELWFRRCRESPALPPGLFEQRHLLVQPNHHALFLGKRVAVTKSRDNLLPWIRDWAYFLAKAHGCNAILFYDNASTSYSTAELRQTISTVPGIETAIVVDWPYKFGPGGEPHWIWDSDFSQYTILEHARHRFLAMAEVVLQTDIDEFVLTGDGVSVFDLTANSKTGYVRFGGRWIENATAKLPEPAQRRHRDYVYHCADGENRPVREKWALVPQRCRRSAQWRVHDVTKMRPDPVASAAASLRHFKAININWNANRWRLEWPDAERHRIDEDLVRQLRLFDNA